MSIKNGAGNALIVATLMGLALALLTLFGLGPVRADLTPAALDTGFSPTSGANNDVYAVALQPDGKALIGGIFTSVDGQSRARVARLMADGTLDPPFVPDAITGVAVPAVWAIAIQPDGKVLIAGDFTQVSGVSRKQIARLNADGSLDTSFDTSSGPNGLILDVAVQPDGKALIGGAFTQVGGESRNYVARLNADGSLDTTFDPGTGANGSVQAIALQDDGKVIVGGEFNQVDSQDRHHLARLNSDGSLDPGFDTGASLPDGPNWYVYAAALQSDGKVLIGGEFSQVDDVSRVRIARLTTNGSLDTSFDPGTGANGKVWAVGIQPDGKVVIGGEFTQVDGTGRNRIARLEADGSLDATYNPGTGANTWVTDLVVQPQDSKSLIGGRFSDVNAVARGRIARLNADGSVDTGFDVGDGTNKQVLAMALQADGKILIGGDFTKFDGDDAIRVARLHANGLLDTSFDTSVNAPDDRVEAVAWQPDGKIIIGGSFLAVGAIPITRTARLEADGSLDTSFDPGDGPSGLVTAIAVQDDGKVLIGGGFSKVDNETRRCLARLNANGSLDTAFDTGGGFMGGVPSSGVRSMVIQADDKILVGGNFTQVDGTSRNHIARLNTNGSLDTSFDPGTGTNDKVLAVALQSDGKVVIGGEFTAVDGISRTYVARLNADGSPDTSFDPGVVTDTVSTDRIARIESVAVQSDGKVVIVGKFTEVDGVSCSRVARLNADGSVDSGFDTSTGPSGTSTGVLLQPDGKILIKGGFLKFGNQDVEGMARLNGMTPPAFSSGAPADGAMDKAYSHTFIATGFPAPTFYVSGGNLPSGLTLERASGLLSGTPTTRATFLFTVTASNYTAPSAHQAVSLNVKGETLTEISAHTPDPSVVGQLVTVEYAVGSVYGTPTGNVTVSDGAQSCSAAVAAGSCTLTFSSPGTRTLTATYEGDADFVGSVSDGVEHTVHKAGTMTAITTHTPDPSEVGQSVSVQYTVTSAWGTPSGDVTVSDGTANCMGTVAGGTCTLAFSTPGTKTLTATYTGDANFAGSVSAGVNHVVNAADTTEYEVYLPIVVRNH